VHVLVFINYRNETVVFVTINFIHIPLNYTILNSQISVTHPLFTWNEGLHRCALAVMSMSHYSCLKTPAFKKLIMFGTGPR